MKHLLLLPVILQTTLRSKTTSAGIAWSGEDIIIHSTELPLP